VVALAGVVSLMVAVKVSLPTVTLAVTLSALLNVAEKPLTAPTKLLLVTP
jgi:hypothetical protein